MPRMRKVNRRDEVRVVNDAVRRERPVYLTYGVPHAQPERYRIVAARRVKGVLQFQTLHGDIRWVAPTEWFHIEIDGRTETF